MLILTRFVGQTVIIADDIRVTICDVDRNRVVLVGIDAPEDIQVRPEEDCEKIQRKRNARGRDRRTNPNSAANDFDRSIFSQYPKTPPGRSSVPVPVIKKKRRKFWVREPEAK